MNNQGGGKMSIHINSLTKYYKIIANHYKVISIVGIIIFLPDLIKILIKGINNIDKIDLFADLIVYITLLIVVTIVRKKYKD